MFVCFLKITIFILISAFTHRFLSSFCHSFCPTFQFILSFPLGFLPSCFLSFLLPCAPIPVYCYGPQLDFVVLFLPPLCLILTISLFVNLMAPYVGVTLISHVGFYVDLVLELICVVGDHGIFLFRNSL